MNPISTMQRVNWVAVLTFILLACAWSWPFYWWRDMHAESWMVWRFPMPLKNTLLMWGPGIAALICFWLFRKKHQSSVSIFGQTRLRSLVFYFLPMTALAIVGIRITGTGIVHAMVIAFSVVGMINILGEELGWRGFLQDALRPLPKSARYIVIGLVWTGWHFTSLFAHRQGQELWMYLAWFLPVTIALSVLIGEAVDRTRAVLVAVTLHAWLEILQGFSGTGTYAVFAGSILFWWWMLKNWPASKSE